MYFFFILTLPLHWKPPAFPSDIQRLSTSILILRKSGNHFTSFNRLAAANVSNTVRSAVASVKTSGVYPSKILRDRTASTSMWSYPTLMVAITLSCGPVSGYKMYGSAYAGTQFISLFGVPAASSNSVSIRSVNRHISASAPEHSRF